MTAVDNGVDYRVPPADYAALYTAYQPIIVGLIKQRGVPPEHVDDVAAEIMLKLIERGVLDLFDPQMLYLYGTDFRPARFKTFITRHVMLYARGQRDKVFRRANREMQGFDEPRTDGTTWLDDLVQDAGHEDWVLDRMDIAETISGIRAYLAEVEPRSKYDTLDLVWLFDRIVAQLMETGRFNAQELCQEIGVSTTAFYTWRRWLARHVGAYLGEQSAKGTE